MGSDTTVAQKKLGRSNSKTTMRNTNQRPAPRPTSAASKRTEPTLPRKSSRTNFVQFQFGVGERGNTPSWEPYRIGDRTKSGRNLQTRKEELHSEMGSPRIAKSTCDSISQTDSPTIEVDGKLALLDDMLLKATKKETVPIVSISPIPPSSPPSNDEPAVSHSIPVPTQIEKTKPVPAPPQLSIATNALSVTLSSGMPKSPNGLKMLSIQKKHISEIQKSPGTPSCDSSIFQVEKPIPPVEIAKTVPVVPQLTLSLNKPPQQTLNVSVLSPTVSPKSPNGLRMLNVAKKHVGEIQKSPGTPSVDSMMKPGSIEFDLSSDHEEPEPLVLKKRPVCIKFDNDMDLYATPATPDAVGITMDNGILVKTPVELAFNLPLGKITYESPRSEKDTARFKELNDELKKKNTEIMELRVMIEQMKHQLELQQVMIDKKEDNGVVHLRSPRSSNSDSPRSRSRNGNELLVRAIMNNNKL
jgi:hypothetical protein